MDNENRIQEAGERIVALTSRIEKYNKNHGADGRFTSGGSVGGGAMSPSSRTHNAAQATSREANVASKKVQTAEKRTYAYSSEVMVANSKAAKLHSDAAMQWGTTSALAATEGKVSLAQVSQKLKARHETQANAHAAAQQKIADWRAKH